MIKLLDQLLKALYKLAQLSLVLCGLVAFVNVVLRYLFNAPLYWGEEATILFLAWIIFLPQGQLEAKDEQLCMTALYSALPGKVKRVMDGLRLVVTVFITLYLAYIALGLARQYFISQIKTYALHIPLGILYSILCLSLICMSLGRSLSFYRKLTKGAEPK